MLKKQKKNKAFALVEILIAASIISVSFLSILAVAQKSAMVSRRSLHTAQASFLLEEEAEAVKIARSAGWSGISALSANIDYFPVFSGGVWSFSTESNSGPGIFSRKIRFDQVYRNSSGDISSSGSLDPDTRLVTAYVFWNDQGTIVSKTLSFYISNIF